MNKIVTRINKDFFSGRIPPMLAKPITRDELEGLGNDFLYERKYDGTRILMFIDKRNKRLRIQNRRFFDKTQNFPEFHGVFDWVNCDSAILDGEVIYENNGKDDFSLLATREHLQDKFRIQLLAKQNPLTYIVFDILYLNGVDLTQFPLEKRKELLGLVVEENDRIKVISTHNNGVELFDEVTSNKGEGIICKKKDSPYQIGKRSDFWLKVKKEETFDVKVLGYKQDSFQSPHGSLITDKCDVSLKSARIRDQYFELRKKYKNIYAEVKGMEETKSGRIRFPVLVRFRVDK